MTKPWHATLCVEHVHRCLIQISVWSCSLAGHNGAALTAVHDTADHTGCRCHISRYFCVRETVSNIIIFQCVRNYLIFNIVIFQYVRNYFPHQYICVVVQLNIVIFQCVRNYFPCHYISGLCFVAPLGDKRLKKKMKIKFQCVRNYFLHYYILMFGKQFPLSSHLKCEKLSPISSYVPVNVWETMSCTRTFYETFLCIIIFECLRNYSFDLRIL